MYVIVVYDVNVERVAKICNFLRRFLMRVQNSVFEGEVKESEFVKIVSGVKKLINKNEDSVIFYKLSSGKFVKREILGVEKCESGNII